MKRFAISSRPSSESMGPGATDTVSYGGVEYSPREAEVRYFLNQFVEQYYGRIRSTLKRDYSRSLYFLDGG